MSEVVFQEKDHKYLDKAGKQLVSVSQLIHCFVPEFDPTGCITRAVAKRDNLTVEQVKEKWKKIADDACIKGSKFHADVELYIKTKKINDNENKLLINQFSKLGWKGRLQSETILYDLKSSLAGTCDLLEFIDNNNLGISDFKTNKTLDIKNKYKKFMLPPFDHIPASNYYIYTLQLNLYAYLMEQKGYWIEYLKILWINPETQKIEIFPVKFLPKETKELVKFAKNPPRHEISIQKQQEEETEEFF